MKYYFFHARFGTDGNASGVWGFDGDLNPIEIIEMVKERIAFEANVIRKTIEFTQFHRVD